MAKRRQPVLKTVLFLLALLALIAAGTVYFLFYFPYRQAQTAMPSQADLVLRENADGTIHLAWPEAKDADLYLLEVYPAEAARSMFGSQDVQPLYSAVMPGQTECDLPALPTEGTVTIRIRSAAWYWTPQEDLLRLGDDPLELTTRLCAPKAEILEVTSAPEKKCVTVHFDRLDSVSSRLYLQEPDGTYRQLAETDGTEFTLTFGQDSQLHIPARGEVYTFRIDGYREETGLAFYGYPTAEFTVEREALLGTVLNLKCENTGNNRFALTWDETRGDRYIIRMRGSASEDWQELAQVNAGTCAFTTAPLPVFTTAQFQVLAADDENAEEPYAAVSEEVTVQTAACAIGATVWPLKDLTVYADPAATEAIGTARAADAYCVLDETDTMFRILHGGQFGYIDSTYCMINLPEFMGSLCAYDITNSYGSIYMVHEYGIPDVTGTVIKGYENIQTAGGQFLVPLLYPTAQRLVNAARTAADEGYQLLIYDAYRPRMATVDIYNTARELMDTPIPESTFAGFPAADMPQPEEGQQLTYGQLMTDGRYSLGQFLAAGYSKHNLGIALDLTLLPFDSTSALQMQSSMHDLSHYSVLSNNNANANTLDRIMKSAGFGGLESEWWHFEDDMLANALGLNCHLYAGVSCACWVSDGIGWRYRNADGSFAADTSKSIDGTVFHFDAQGFVTDAPWTVQ